jgi:hypothetical protein
LTHSTMKQRGKRQREHAIECMYTKRLVCPKYSLGFIAGSGSGISHSCQRNPHRPWRGADL